jgi:hypothetical protein
MAPRSRLELAGRSVVIAACVALLAGCVADGPARGPGLVSPPRTEGVVPTGIVLVAPSAFSDTDGDGQLDEARVMVYATAPVPPKGDVLPVKSTGRWMFGLVDSRVSGGRMLARWRFSAEESSLREVSAGPGPGWVFSLRIPQELSMQAGRLNARAEGELWAEFWPDSEAMAEGNEPWSRDDVDGKGEAQTGPGPNGQRGQGGRSLPEGLRSRRGALIVWGLSSGLGAGSGMGTWAGVGR